MEILKKQLYTPIGEEIFYGTLKNGLKIYLIPKKDLQETCGMLLVNFGSLDTKFTVGKVSKSYPEGIAHFLEHKLFELDDNQDLSQLFTHLGAESNAFTSFEKTCFYFSTVDNITENLKLLQKFMRQASFSEASVEREKDIIGQEIDMYQDDADYRLYQGILENLYPKTSLAEDIAGTRKSLDKITATDLEENHNLFYSPENLTLLLVGDFNPDQIFKQVKNSQYEWGKSSSQLASKEQFVYEKVIPTRSISMDVTLPKLAIGYRGRRLDYRQSLLRQLLSLKLFFGMLLGWTSETYQTLYELGKIDDSFDFEIEVHLEFQFLIISMDTMEPIAMSNRLRLHLKKALKSRDLSAQHFQRAKKEMYGEFMRSLNSVDQIASQFIMHLSEIENYLDVPTILMSLDFGDVLETGKQFLEQSDMTDFIILPK